MKLKDFKRSLTVTKSYSMRLFAGSSKFIGNYIIN